MVEFHTGYELDEDDYHDVKALCEKFSIALPEEYKKFEVESPTISSAIDLRQR